MAILLADIGGTHARFAWYKNHKLGKMRTLDCDLFQTPIQLIDYFIKTCPERITGMMLSVAAVIQRDKAQWTNRPQWKISQKKLQTHYHLEKVKLVNDMVAQGVGLSQYKSGRSILMNIGTGLGCCFITQGQVCPCEFGLVINPDNYKKEYFLSGAGIVRLYHQLGGDKKITSAKLLEARRKIDKKAEKAYQQFYQLWGQTAANLATGLLANDGVFLWGGLVPRNPKDLAMFKKAFLNPKYPAWTRKIPVRIIGNQKLSFNGLMILAKREFG